MIEEWCEEAKGKNSSITGGRVLLLHTAEGHTSRANQDGESMLKNSKQEIQTTGN